MSSNNTAVAVLNPKPLDIEAIYERYVSTYATCNVEKIKMLHTENSKFWLHSAGAKPVLGRDAIAETFAGVFKQWPRAGFEVYRTVFGERHWTLDWAMTAILKGPDGSDRPVRFDAIDLVEVDDTGLVVRKDTFVDAAQVKEAIAAAS